jgi:hypothetical protein
MAALLAPALQVVALFLAEVRLVAEKQKMDLMARHMAVVVVALQVLIVLVVAVVAQLLYILQDLLPATPLR